MTVGKRYDIEGGINLASTTEVYEDEVRRRLWWLEKNEMVRFLAERCEFLDACVAEFARPTRIRSESEPCLGKRQRPEPDWVRILFLRGNATSADALLIPGKLDWGK